MYVGLKIACNCLIWTFRQKPLVIKPHENPGFSLVGHIGRHTSLRSRIATPSSRIISRSSNLKGSTASAHSLISQSRRPNSIDTVPTYWKRSKLETARLQGRERGHRVPLFERPGYEETSAFPRSCHRDCELGNIQDGTRLVFLTVF